MVGLQVILVKEAVIREETGSIFPLLGASKISYCGIQSAPWATQISAAVSALQMGLVLQHIQSLAQIAYHPQILLPQCLLFAKQD